VSVTRCPDADTHPWEWNGEASGAAKRRGI